MQGKARSLSLLISTLLVSGAANANNFSYNNFDFNIGSSPTSFGMGFSTQFTENSHFIVSGESQFEGDWILTGGVGFNGPVNQFADIYGHLLLNNVKEGSDELVGEDFLPEFGLGARVWLLQNVEVYGDIGQLIDGDETHTSYNAGARFHSTQQLVLGAGLRNNGIYGGQFMMNVRFQY
ncbi:hypothetical protein P7F88_05005 [Vibrio hannami]|uniref:hypothetical protein n=1 Tax=Vibrio hannami TaxID=2717094 RepID=UPI00240F3877|nr:hypothetical protein [Vibrio hannami]MDG3085493.1 hypothetical protein [Vibrio hannami]